MRVVVSQLIAAPAEALFELSQDYSRRLSWDPFLREAKLLDHAQSARAGVRSWCVTWFGIGMESEYVSYDSPKVVAVKMTRGPGMLRQFAATWKFEPAGQDRTEVTFLYSFQLTSSVRWLGPVVRALFRYEMRRRLRALKQAGERG